MSALKKFSALLKRHAQAFWYVLTIILPVILRTGRRPVIFSKYSGIGDIICTFPAVLELKKRHPQATFIYNCHKPYACLPLMGELAQCVTSLPYAGLLKHWYHWLVGGFYEFPCADELPDSFCKDYVVKEYAHDHGVDVVASHPRLKISAAAQAKTKKIITGLCRNLGPVIVIQTGPTWPIREWPRENWGKLINGLKQSGFANVIQIGTEHHLSVGKATAIAIPGAESLVNQLSLEESAAAIEAGDLFIGIDSGLLHIAAALRIPCVGIFGPTTPRLRLPVPDVNRCVVSQVECQGCHHRVPRIHWETGCPYDARCMKMISVDEVLSACLKVLTENTPRNARA